MSCDLTRCNYCGRVCDDCNCGEFDCEDCEDHEEECPDCGNVISKCECERGYYIGDQWISTKKKREIDDYPEPFSVSLSAREMENEVARHFGENYR